jgi:hypothetical protein
LIKKEDYQIIHCNSGSVFFNLQVAAISKLSGAKKIIIHSHNAGNDKKWKVWLGNSSQMAFLLIQRLIFLPVLEKLVHLCLLKK